MTFRVESGSVDLRLSASACHWWMSSAALAITRLRTPVGWVFMYSRARIVPHDVPRMWTCARPSAWRTAATSRTKRSMVHKLESAGAGERPQPSWS